MHVESGGLVGGGAEWPKKFSQVVGLLLFSFCSHVFPVVFQQGRSFYGDKARSGHGKSSTRFTGGHCLDGDGRRSPKKSSKNVSKTCKIESRL